MTTYRSTGYTAKPKNPINTVGKKIRTVPFIKTITDAESEANDLYILGGPFTYDMRLAGILGANPAQTSNNDADLGLYRYDEDSADFVAIDADCIWDGADLTSAVTFRDLLLNYNSSLDTTKNFRELIGATVGSDQEPDGGVYLGLLNKVASTGGTLLVNWQIQIEEATTSYS